MTTCPACSRPVHPGQTYHIQCEPDGRFEELKITLQRWREMYALTEDGREFISIPIAVFDAALSKTEGREG